jgi:hypothetical protein
MTLNSLLSCWNYSLRFGSGDFYMFWVVPHILSEQGISTIYVDPLPTLMGEIYYQDAQEGESKRLQKAATFFRTLEPNSTPFLFATFAPFVSNDYDFDAGLFAALSLICSALAIIVFMRWLSFSRLEILAVLAYYTTWFEPLASNLSTGNVNCLQLALVAMYLALLRLRPELRSTNFSAGALMGAIVMFKPNTLCIPLFMTIHWIAGGERRRAAYSVLGNAAGVALAVAASTAIMRPSAWLEWLQVISTRLDSDFTVANGNCSLTAILHGLEGVPPQITFVIPALVMILTCITLLLAARRREVQKRSILRPDPGSRFIVEVKIVSLGLLAGVLCSKPSWLHYYLLTLPAFFALFESYGRRESRVGLLLTIAGFVLMASPLQYVAGFDADETTAVAVAYCLVAVLMYIALMVDLFRPAKEDGLTRMGVVGR